MYYGMGKEATLIYDPIPCPQFGYRCSACNMLHLWRSYTPDEVPKVCNKCGAIFTNYKDLTD